MPPRSRDPTRTTTIRRQYARKLRGRFDSINTRIREDVREQDKLGFEQLAEPMPDLSRFSEGRTEELFSAWLDQQLDEGVMGAVGTNRNQYIQRAYDSGLRSANASLNRSNVDVATSEIARLRNQPVHRDRLELLFTRDREALDGITSAVSKESSRVLGDSLMEEASAGVAANKLTDRIDTVGKTRATTHARSHVVKTHNEATLTRYQQVLGDGGEVEVEAEILTANDSRVCDICEPKHGEVMTVKEARSDPPPYHPECRCTVRVS